MKSKLIIRFTLVFLVLLSCTKQIDDSILDVDIEELLVEVDPILSTENAINSVDDVYLNGDVVESFDYEIMESDQFIRIVLPSGSNVSSVSIDFTMAENASLASSISGLNFTGTGIKLISVVAENGDTRTYALKIIVTGGVDPMPSPYEIISVTSVTASGIVVIPIEPVVFSDNSINVLLPAGTPLTDISFEFEITENSFLLDDATNLSFESGATNEVRLESEEGEVRIYTITVELENTPDLSDKNDITKITATIGDAPNVTIIDEREAPEFDGSNSIILEVPFKTAISDVDLEFELSEFATLQIDDITTGLDFTSGIVKMFTVVAQDGSEQTYGIQVVIADPTQREALLEMYNPDGLFEEDQWDLSEGSDIGLWTGVTTNADGNVIGLHSEAEQEPLQLNRYLEYLPFLQTIDASDSEMRLPSSDEMEGVVLPNLESIEYEDGAIPNLGSWLVNQPSLLSIELGTNTGSSIPANIGSFPSLTTLVLGETTGVTTIPESIGNLTTLERLSVYSVNLETGVPESIAQLPNLVLLNIGDTPNLVIPQAICDWGEVDGHTLIKDNTAVCDGDTGITEKQALFNMYTLYKGDIDNPADEWLLENDISSWKGLELETQADGDEHVIGITLTSDFEAMTTFDGNLNYLPYLKNITILDADFSLPTPFADYNTASSQIESITFESNNFKLEDWIIELPNLKELFLEDSLEAGGLPENIGNMASLEKLAIGFSLGESTGLPGSFSNITSLKEINFDNCSFESIPLELLSMNNLESLSFRDNGLVTLPTDLMTSLPGLSYLDITDNTELISIPQVICTALGVGLIKDTTQICETNASDNNYLTSLYLSDANGTQYPADLTAIENIAITIEVPFSTDVTNLETVFAFDSTAISSVNSPVAHNFESPLVIEITAENLDQREYTISITRAAMTQREALLSMYDESLDTNGDWNPDGDMNDWQGVTASGENVTEINFDSGSQPYIILNENLGILINLEKIHFLEFDNGFGNGTRVPNTIVNNSFNSLTRFSAEFVNFEDSTIPEWIMNSSSLQELFLWETSGEEIPASIINLTELTTLVIERSLVTEIPDYVGQLTTLETLSVSEGILNSVDPAITNLTNLKILQLNSNSDLVYLPQSICEFGATLDTFSVDNENICSPYTAEVQSQRDALLSMYSESSDDEGDWSSEDWNDWSGITIEDDKVVAINWNDIEDEYLNINENIGALKYLRTIDVEYQQLPLTIVTESGEQVFPFLETVFNNEASQSEIPQWVFNSTSLKSLQIEHGTFTDIEGIEGLVNLEKLVIEQANLLSVPESIGNLQNLQTLEISDNESLQSLPNSIGDLFNLTSLDLSNNDLTALPISIGNLTSLETLRLSRNNFTTLPSSIGNLGSLQYLYIDGNDNLPNELWQLSNLKTLSISEGNLTELSSQIDNLINLEDLSISDNNLSNFPDEITNITTLKKLTYSGSTGDLIVVPTQVFDVTSLTTLILGNVSVGNLTSDIGNLINLESLSIRNSGLVTLPPEIGNLSFLQRLNIGNNLVSNNSDITELPNELANLEELNYLNIQNTFITSVQREVCDIIDFNSGSLFSDQFTTCD